MMPLVISDLVIIVCWLGDVPGHSAGRGGDRIRVGWCLRWFDAAVARVSGLLCGFCINVFVTTSRHK